MTYSALIAVRNSSRGAQIAPLANARVLKCGSTGCISAQAHVTHTHQARRAGSIAHRGRLAVILFYGRKNEIRLQLIALLPIALGRRVAGILQVVWLEEYDTLRRHRVAMHSEFAVAEDLHASPHVVLHEDAAVAAALIPLAGESVTILERRVYVVAVVHHQPVTGTMQTVEQSKLFFGAAQAIARSQQYRLRDCHSHSGIEVALQDSVITPRLVSVVAL